MANVKFLRSDFDVEMTDVYFCRAVESSSQMDPAAASYLLMLYAKYGS
tara:strand:+ start:448 stop:591 length:144 start_codon:yes stop_codon:yes gene_type:complete